MQVEEKSHFPFHSLESLSQNGILKFLGVSGELQIFENDQMSAFLQTREQGRVSLPILRMVSDLSHVKLCILETGSHY